MAQIRHVFVPLLFSCLFLASPAMAQQECEALMKGLTQNCTVSRDCNSVACTSLSLCSGIGCEAAFRGGFALKIDQPCKLRYKLSTDFSINERFFPGDYSGDSSSVILVSSPLLRADVKLVRKGSRVVGQLAFSTWNGTFMIMPFTYVTQPSACTSVSRAVALGVTISVAFCAIIGVCCALRLNGNRAKASRPLEGTDEFSETNVVLAYPWGDWTRFRHRQTFTSDAGVYRQLRNSGLSDEPPTVLPEGRPTGTTALPTMSDTPTFSVQAHLYLDYQSNYRGQSESPDVPAPPCTPNYNIDAFLPVKQERILERTNSFDILSPPDFPAHFTMSTSSGVVLDED